MNSNYKQAVLHGGNKAYDYGNDTSGPKHNEANGYEDMADFMRWHGAAEILFVYQEQTHASLERKFYRYIVFYREPYGVPETKQVPQTPSQEQSSVTKPPTILEP